MTMLADALGLTLFPAMMAFAAASDLLTMTIPNRVALALVGGFFALALVTGVGAAQTLWHLGAGCLVLAVAFALFSRGWIGGGDAKLAAVTALWFDPQNALLYFVYASVLGGFLTLAILQLRAAALPSAFYRVPWLVQLRAPKAGVPYGAAMAPAALIVFPDTAWVAHAAF